jgi:hypothetical protein
VEAATTSTLLDERKPMTIATLNGRARATGMVTTKEFVTPELALEWLARNENNRNLRKADVEYLKECILAGEFKLTHQGIAFYQDDELADGQHRLHAIMEAGVGVWMYVTRGVPREAAGAIDRGIPRSNKDHLHFSGVRSDTRRVAACICMINQYRAERSENATRWSKRRMRPDKFAAFYAAFSDAIEFAYESNKQLHACVVAAIASAWFTSNRDRLAQFRSLLASGAATDAGDLAAIKLRDFLLKKQYGQGESARNDLFLKACSALRAFLDCRPLSKLYATNDHAFPIPTVR